MIGRHIILRSSYDSSLASPARQEPGGVGASDRPSSRAPAASGSGQSPETPAALRRCRGYRRQIS